MSFGSKAERLSSQKNIVLDFLKGIIVATVTSLVSVVVLALFVKWFSLSDKVIAAVTMVIKAASVVLGAIFAVKGESRGLVKGAIFGLVYILFSICLFGLLSGSISFSIMSLLDIVSACLVGGIVGIVKVNKK